MKPIFSRKVERAESFLGSDGLPAPLNHHPIITEDATDFIRQCYSRYLSWCKRPTDFVFIADSLTSVAGTVVDGHIRVDGLHLLSKRSYDEGLGQRNGVPGLGSMRIFFTLK
jgi:hypothetical protein